MGSAFAANPHIVIFACAKVLLLHLITLFFSKKNLKNQQFYKKRRCGISVQTRLCRKTAACGSLALGC